MKRIKTVWFYRLPALFLTGVAFSWSSCVDTRIIPEDTHDSAHLSISFEIRAAGNESHPVNDKTVSSLAFFLFDRNGQKEYSERVPDLTGYPGDRYSRTIPVSREDKVLYVIGNYAASSTFFTPGLDENISMDDLESAVTRAVAFSGKELILSGRQPVVIGTEKKTRIAAEMERLTARIDVHVFKSDRLADTEVELTGITFCNQVMNARVFDGDGMPEQPEFRSESWFAEKTCVLATPPTKVDGSPEASFFSLPSRGERTEPDETVTPYLLISVKVGGKSRTFRGYLTDGNQQKHKYELLRNTVYRVLAVLDPEHDPPSAALYPRASEKLPGEDDGIIIPDFRPVPGGLH